MVIIPLQEKGIQYSSDKEKEDDSNLTNLDMETVKEEDSTELSSDLESSQTLTIGGKTSYAAFMLSLIHI